ncbi:MAG TPA: acetylglutamate kinase [bacterium]|nr:acetylglutamate kinase [bacterium]
MDEEVVKKADVLVEAYPYIRQYRDKIFVIKFGGSIFRLTQIKENILKDIAFLEAVGVKTLLVCGGGPFINEEIEKRGKKPRFVEGLRVTDEETLVIVKEVLSGIRDKIVGYYRETLDVKASSLLPEEKFMLARKIHYQQGEKIINLGFVGQVASVDSEYIKMRFEKEKILVAAPVVSSEDNIMYNINGDAVASGLAESMKVEKLIFITDVLGVMRNPENPQTLISMLRHSEVEDLISSNVIKEGMIPKVSAGISAISKGVKKVHIISGNVQHSIILEVFTEHGIGTEITN